MGSRIIEILTYKQTKKLRVIEIDFFFNLPKSYFFKVKPLILYIYQFSIILFSDLLGLPFV